VVVDFAVEDHDDTTVFTVERLRATFGIKQNQPPMSQHNTGLAVEASPIGTAMHHRLQHALDGGFIAVIKTVEPYGPC
jgi:hypothetical protein